MNTDGTNTPDNSPPEDINAVIAARRKKLNNIRELGYDPWGQRFDDRSWVGDIRARQTEIKFQTTSGSQIDPPEFVEGHHLRRRPACW